MIHSNNNRTGYFLILISGILWGTIGIFVKEMSLGGADALSISFIRVVFAFFLMLLITLVRSGAKSLRFSRRQILFGFLLGIVCHGIYNIFYSYAVTLAGVSVSAVLLNIAPAATLLFSVFFFSELLTKTKVLAIAIDIAGCTLAATGGDFSLKSVSIIGIICGIGAGLCYAMTAVLGRLTMEECDAFASSTLSYLAASIFLFIPSKPWNLNTTSCSLGYVLLMGFLLALIPTCIAYILYYKGLSLVDETGKVPVLASGETAVATILGIVIYSEPISAISITGIILVFFSIILINGIPLKVSQPSNRKD